MVLGITAGFSQSTITLDLPDLVGYQNGETVTIPVMATDVIMPNEVSSFYIYVEWDDAVLDYVDAALSPEMAANIGPLSFIFQKGNASAGGIETTVGAWIDTFTGSTFSMNPGDVFFNITATYVGDGSDVLGVGATELNFQFSSKDEGGKLSKGVTEIIDASFTLFDLTYEVPAGGVNVPMVAEANMWTGAVNNDWFEAGNWSDAVVPTTEDVIIDVTAKGDPVIFGGSATTGALTVMTGAGLAVDVSSDLTTSGLFTCDGDFELLTDATGYSGSFIDMGGLAGAGTFTMDRMVTCTTGGDPNDPEDPFGWHYISAPIDGLSTDDMLDFYVNQWDETAGMFMNYAGSPTIPCDPFAGTETLDGMEVFSVKFDELFATTCPSTITNGPVLMYSGPFTALHTGPYSAAATVTAGAYAGWNQFANPYPSGLDLNAIVWDANAIPGAALYDCSNYGYWSPATGAYSMPVGNGFFTEFTAPGTFSLTGAERAHNPDFYYKEDITSLLVIEATGDETSDVTYIRFMENAQAGFAPDGDFHKLFATTEGLAQIYTTAGADQLAINALPATDMVPMGFTSATSGEYTIGAIETSEFAEVYLQDIVTGDVTDLLNDSYTFDYVTGDDANRFIIHFAPVGIGELNAQNVKIWSHDNNIMVNVPADVTGEIAVYNMMGQEVARTDIEAFETQIQVSDVNTNYVVKVISDNSAVTGKVYVK